MSDSRPSTKKPQPQPLLEIAMETATNSTNGHRHGSKSAWIVSQGDASVDEVMAAAKAAGIKVSRGTVYSVQSAHRRKRTKTKATAKPGRRKAPRANSELAVRRKAERMLEREEATSALQYEADVAETQSDFLRIVIQIGFARSKVMLEQFHARCLAAID